MQFRVILAAPDGTEVFNAFYSDLQITLSQTGIYSLRIEGLQITNTGVYSFRLLEVPAPQEFVISIGDTVSNGIPAAGAGNLETPGAVDIYRFDGTAGQGLIFDTLIGNVAQFRAILAAPDGTQVFNVFYADQQTTLPQTGTYILTLSGLQIALQAYTRSDCWKCPLHEFIVIAVGDTARMVSPLRGRKPGSAVQWTSYL
jgi:hypothetical protein